MRFERVLVAVVCGGVALLGCDDDDSGADGDAGTGAGGAGGSAAGGSAAGGSAAGGSAAGGSAAGGSAAGGSAGGAGGAGTGGAGTGGTPDYGFDLSAELPAPGEWIEVEPGGESVCSRGDDYRFFVRGGDPSKVIVDFQGGGACWNADTCSVADAIFSDSTGTLQQLEAAAQAGLLDGTLFSDGDENPYKDWTIIHVPYCTGDIHWGDSVIDYSDSLTIRHKGYVNARSALEWLEQRVEDPSHITVSGCSAGAYGAIMHSAYIANHYTEAQIAVLADSGAGIITDTFLEDSLPNWGAEPNIPPFIPSLQVPITELSLPQLYIEVAGAFPDARFSQLSTQFDADQTFYFTVMGGMRSEWNQRFRASIDEIAEAAPNFRYYVQPGSVHCSMIYPFMVEREVEGVKLVDFAYQMSTGDTAPDSVACEGEGCYDDPICDACVSGETTGGWCRFCQGWPDDYRFDE